MRRYEKMVAREDRQLLELKALETPLALMAKRLQGTESGVDNKLSKLKKHTDLRSRRDEFQE